MKSLKLNFNSDGADFDLVQIADGFTCDIQAALVNIGTMAGSDRAYPEKGTNLLKAGVRSALFDIVAANHASNFAALSTLLFIRDHDYDDNPNPLAKIILKPALYDGRLLKLDAEFTGEDGTVSGVLTNLL